MRAEYHRCTRPRAASSNAMPATISASLVTSGPFCFATPSSMIRWNSSGVATTVTAEMTTSTRKAAICGLYGRANDQMRRNVPGASLVSVTDSSRRYDARVCHGL